MKETPITGTPEPLLPPNPAEDLLSGGNPRREAAACPTGLSGLQPSPVEDDAHTQEHKHVPLEVELLEGRQGAGDEE